MGRETRVFLEQNGDQLAQRVGDGWIKEQDGVVEASRGNEACL